MLAKLKMLLGIKGTEQDDRLNFLLELVTDEILNYCHLESLPTGLSNVALLMCVDAYRQVQMGQQQLKAEVRSVSRGDTSTGFKTASEQTMDAIKSPSFMLNYKQQLLKFRKMRG